MAGSRPRFQVVSRSDGRSACAMAAYRAAAMIECRTYGETMDYRAKSGVLHAEIIAPEHAPDWARDRAALWNAVEQSEVKKNGELRVSAQLAREIVVPLAHELDFETNRAALREWIAGEFVSRGMVADYAMHAPNRRGDERNVHAHVMLTMREITPEGFHAKKATETARSWNRKELLEGSIERWRDIQNRELERAGLDVRVRFDSFEAQGVDREPQQHEGPAATNKRRRGEESRIGRENDERARRNAARAALHVEALKALAQIAAERERFESWAAEKRGQLEAAQALTQLDQTRVHEDRTAELEDSLREFYGPHLKTVRDEARQVEARLTARGVLPTMRRLFTGREDRLRLDDLRATIRDTETRMREARGKLEAEQAVEKARLAQLQEQRLQQQHEGIERARERKEQTLAARLAEAQQRAAQASQEKQERTRRAEAERAQGERIQAQKGDREKEANAEPLTLAERVRAAQQRQAESYRQKHERTRQEQGPEIER